MSQGTLQNDLNSAMSATPVSTIGDARADSCSEEPKWTSIAEADNGPGMSYGRCEKMSETSRNDESRCSEARKNHPPRTPHPN